MRIGTSYKLKQEENLGLSIMHRIVTLLDAARDILL